MTTDWQPAEGITLLTDSATPSLVDAQLSLFTTESIHTERVTEFDVAAAVDRLDGYDGKRIVAADFGGDKGIVREFSITSGRLELTDDYADDIQGDNGAGYYDTVAAAAVHAEVADLPLGISWGGPLAGSRLLFHPKATQFYDDVTKHANGDLRAISPAVTAVLNDGPAGLISGAVEAYRRFGATNVLFIINGGGIGLGVLKDGVLYATEAGHVEGAPELNKYDQTQACGVFDAPFVCLERLGANKAGIEPQWQAVTGAYMRAKDIEDEYKNGNRLALELYDHSAFVIAHVLAGAAQALEIDLTSSSTAIVAHGGAFKFPYYGERVAQILAGHFQTSPQLIMTKNFGESGSNACLDGAAIAALLAV